MTKIISAVLCAHLLGVFTPTHAAPPPEGATANPQPVPCGMSIEPSQRMRGNGIPWDHEIRVALPSSYRHTTRAYPVLWVLDGDLDLAVLNLCLADDHVPEMIVVSVGPPPEAIKEFQKRRSYDFTPTENWMQIDGYDSELIEKVTKSLSPAEYGGASLFLSFLVDVVRPALAKDYRMANINTLFGHSGGGIFCIAALLERPESFNKYICGSPVLFGGKGVLFRREAEYARTHKDMKADVFFGAGEGEATEDTIATFGIVSSTTRMVETLHSRKYPSLGLHLRVFPGEEHGSVKSMNMYWGLTTLWQDQCGQKP